MFFRYDNLVQMLQRRHIITESWFINSKRYSILCNGIPPIYYFSIRIIIFIDIISWYIGSILSIIEREEDEKWPSSWIHRYSRRLSTECWIITEEKSAATTGCYPRSGRYGST